MDDKMKKQQPLDSKARFLGACEWLIMVSALSRRPCFWSTLCSIIASPLRKEKPKWTCSFHNTSNRNFNKKDQPKNKWKKGGTNSKWFMFSQWKFPKENPCELQNENTYTWDKMDSHRLSKIEENVRVCRLTERTFPIWGFFFFFNKKKGIIFWESIHYKRQNWRSNYPTTNKLPLNKHNGVSNTSLVCQA